MRTCLASKHCTWSCNHSYPTLGPKTFTFVSFKLHLSLSLH